MGENPDRRQVLGGGLAAGAAKIVDKIAKALGTSEAITVGAGGALIVGDMTLSPSAEARPRGEKLDDLGKVVKCLFDWPGSGLMAALQNVNKTGIDFTKTFDDRKIWGNRFPQLTRLDVAKMTVHIAKRSGSVVIEVTAYNSKGDDVCGGQMGTK